MIVFAGAAPVGLLTGLLAWLVAGGPSVQARALDVTEARLAAIRPERGSGPASRAGGAAALLGAPLFAVAGAAAEHDPSVRLDGVSVTRRRMAALISLDGKPAEWMSLGESREGVTLRTITTAGVTLDTASGEKTVSLGDGPVGAAGPAAQGLDGPPPGVRLPPEPASAPRGG